MKNMQILIIEDDQDNANLFKHVLTEAGFVCDVALTAKQGLRSLAHSEPAMVFLDLRLGPEIGGEDILYQIRTNPRLANVKVVVISGNPEMIAPIQPLADLILYKPIDVEQLKLLALRLSTVEDKPIAGLFRDPFSGLFNREFYYTRLEQAFERSKRKPHFLFVIFIISLALIDERGKIFEKEISPHLLHQISDRLKRGFRLTDTLARYGELEFSTLHEDLKHPKDVQIIHSRLQERLNHPYSTDHETLTPTITLGNALQLGQFKSVDEIVEAAKGSIN